MRSVSLAALFLCGCLAVAVGQQQGDPQVPSPGVESQGTTAAPGQQAAPDQSMAPHAEQVLEGCLGGTAPNFTVTDTAGTVYQLLIPANADTAPIAQHVGESVQVKGALSGAAGAGASAAGTQPSIQVSQMGRGTGTCSKGAGANSPAK